MRENEWHYEMNRMKEHQQMEQDFLVGRGLEILICLVDGCHSQMDIGKRLEIPYDSVGQYLKRFVKAGFVIEETDANMEDGETVYSLASNQVDIVNPIELDGKLQDQRQFILSLNHYMEMIKKAICKASTSDEKVSSIKSFVLKIKKENVEQMIIELDHLFEKYQNKEETDEEMYSIFSVLAPYNNDQAYRIQQSENENDSERNIQNTGKCIAYEISFQ